MLIVYVQCGLLLRNHCGLLPAVFRLVVHIVLKVRGGLVLDLQVLNVDDLLGGLIKKSVRSVRISVHVWLSLILSVNMGLLHWVDDVGRISKLLKKGLLVDSGGRLVVADGRIVTEVPHVLGLHGAPLLGLNIMKVFVSVLLHVNIN